MDTISILQKYKSICNTLEEIHGLNEAQAMGRILIEKVTGIKAHDAIANPNLLLSISQNLLLNTYVEELKLQKPIQYILGETEFFGITLKVNPNVLIPRPETEELVEWIIRSNDHGFPSILDIGTGSGCIAIALAKHLPAARVFGVDISQEALALAKGNSIRANTSVNFIHADILSLPNPIEGSPFDIIVSNPPYVCESEKELMQPNVLEYEPHLALFVNDSEPLLFYKAIAQIAKMHLNPNGIIYCEINEAYGKETTEIFKDSGFNDIEVRKDINGKKRMLRARREKML